MKNYKLNLKDESVLLALKENFLQRQRIFTDMQKEIQAAGPEDSKRENNMTFTSLKQEKEEMEHLITTLSELVKKAKTEVSPDEERQRELSCSFLRCFLYFSNEVL